MTPTNRHSDTDDGGREKTITNKGPKYGPLLPVGEGGVSSASGSGTEVRFSYLSGNDRHDGSYDVSDYGSSWVTDGIAQGVRARSLGLPDDAIDGYDLNEIALRSVGEGTQVPPKLFEGGQIERDQNSTAGTNPSSDTGQIRSGNYSRRTTVGHPLSVGANSGGTIGSTGNQTVKEIDLSRARELLRLYGQPYQYFGEDTDTVKKRVLGMLTNNPNSFLLGS